MQHYTSSVTDTFGNAVSGATINVYIVDTTTAATIYSDNSGTSTTNPLTSEADGSFDFYADNGTYDLVITHPSHTFDDADTANISLFDPISGSWTPSVGGSATYTVRVGTYYKLGLLVFIDGLMTINVLGTGSTTTMSGLPYVVDSDTALTAGVSSGLAVSPVSLEPFASSGTQTIVMYGRTAASAASTSQAIYGNSASIRISGCYLATT